MRLPTCEDGLNNLDKVYCTFAFSTPYFSCSCFVHEPTSNADLIYLMGRIVCFPVYPGRGYGCGVWPILQKATRTKHITCKKFCFSDSQRLHKILQLEHGESWLIISMSRSTFLETELGEVLSCKWLGSPIIAKQWLNNDPTVEDGMLAWSESLGLCREVRCSAKDELPRRSSIDVFLLKRWGVKELYLKPTDVSGVRDGGIEEGSDVKLGWITVVLCQNFSISSGNICTWRQWKKRWNISIFRCIWKCLWHIG